MNCHDAQTWLHPYLDGELDANCTLQYEQHVRACPACAAILAEQKRLLTAMKTDALYYRAPDRLRERLRTLAGEPVARRLRMRWSWVAVAACMLVCIGTGYLIAQLTDAKTDHLNREVVSSHIRSLQAERSRLVDVRSSDRHEVKPWFNDRLDFAPAVRELGKQGFPLIGGRLDYIDGRPVAALVYQRRKHVISVFLWPSAGHVDTPVQQETRQGFHLIHFARSGMNYWIASDLERAELSELAETFRADD
jgi:anti-sigma factor RsiW